MFGCQKGEADSLAGLEDQSAYSVYRSICIMLLKTEYDVVNPIVGKPLKQRAAIHLDIAIMMYSR